jgi:hypothetical protein
MHTPVLGSHPARRVGAQRAAPLPLAKVIQMSNSTVGLQNPEEFLRHVVDADMREFAAPNQAELRLAHHACTSLFSLRDWVYETYRGKVWTYRARQFPAISTKTKFLEDLCAIESDFEIGSDIANASKHMVLDSGRRLTELHGAANVHIQSHGGSGRLDSAHWAEARSVRCQQ